jgi:uncharacterized repeat protein (TIGR03803 family)
VFKIDAAGAYTVLHTFTSAAYPSAGVIRDAAGSLYGTTATNSGTCDGSAVFKLDTAGNYTVLYSFTGEPDGCAGKTLQSAV